MTERNKEISNKDLVPYLAIAIPVIFIAIVNTELKWLSITLLTLAVILLAWVSVVFVRNLRRQRTKENLSCDSEP
jgi:Sec-independent protein secretion pathway component TatC